MSYTVPIVGVAAVAVLAGVIFTTTQNTDSTLSTSPEQLDPVSADIDSPSVNAKPTSQSHSLSTVAETVIENDVAKATTVDEIENVTQEAVVSTSVVEAIDFAQSIARERADDATLNEQANILRNDPAKLAAVLDEFSAETDVKRLGRLRLLLGQLEDSSMVSVAESMVFSGNPESSSEALRLLRDIGPNVPAAQEVGVTILSSTQDPQLLVGATNILTSSANVDNATRERVVGSLSSLVQHTDATVRRASFSTLARWSKDPSVTPILLQGLTDEDPNVRKSTAYGLVGYEHVDSSVITALLSTAENANELSRARSGAILALEGMPLSESQRTRLQAVQAQF